MKTSVGCDYAVFAVKEAGFTVKEQVSETNPDLDHAVVGVMAANKIPGIRCGLTNEPYPAHQAVEHDDANAIAVGAWLAPRAFVEEIVKNVVEATFDNDEDTARRVHKLNALDGLRPTGDMPEGRANSR